MARTRDAAVRRKINGRIHGHGDRRPRLEKDEFRTGRGSSPRGARDLDWWNSDFVDRDGDSEKGFARFNYLASGNCNWRRTIAGRHFSGTFAFWNSDHAR